MEVIKNTDEMSSCNNCLDRGTWAEVILKIGGMSIKLCKKCRKEMMKQIVEVF